MWLASLDLGSKTRKIENNLTQFVSNDQANIAWFSSTRGVYQNNFDRDR